MHYILLNDILTNINAIIADSTKDNTEKETACLALITSKILETKLNIADAVAIASVMGFLAKEKFILTNVNKGFYGTFYGTLQDLISEMGKKSK